MNKNYLRTIDFMYMYDCETQSLTSNVRIPIITFLITALHQSGWVVSKNDTRAGGGGRSQQVSQRLEREKMRWGIYDNFNHYIIIENVFILHFCKILILSNIRFKLFLKVLTYTQFHYLLVKLMMPETSEPHVNDQKNPQNYGKLNSTTLC